MPKRRPPRNRARRKAPQNSGRSAAKPAKVARRADGMPVGRPFPKGVSGNPGGRPKTVKEVQEHASTFTIEAVNRTVDVMRLASDPNVVRQAARDLLDRACGRPVQPLTGGEGRPLEQEFPTLLAALNRLNDPAAVATSTAAEPAPPPAGDPLPSEEGQV